jgi:hypothetical protein
MLFINLACPNYLMIAMKNIPMQNPRMSMSNKFPGDADADAAGLGMKL